jgi:hypothetical protein
MRLKNSQFFFWALLVWCDTGEVCDPSVVNVNVKDYVFACSCVVQGYGSFQMYVEGYRESSFC